MWISTCLIRGIARLLKMRGGKGGSNLEKGVTRTQNGGSPQTHAQFVISFGWAQEGLNFWLESLSLPPPALAGYGPVSNAPKWYAHENHNKSRRYRLAVHYPLFSISCVVPLNFRYFCRRDSPLVNVNKNMVLFVYHYLTTKSYRKLNTGDKTKQDLK